MVVLTVVIRLDVMCGFSQLPERTPETYQTWRSVLLSVICCKFQFGMIHAQGRTIVRFGFFPPARSSTLMHMTMSSREPKKNTRTSLDLYDNGCVVLVFLCQKLSNFLLAVAALTKLTLLRNAFPDMFVDELLRLVLLQFVNGLQHIWCSKDKNLFWSWKQR